MVDVRGKIVRIFDEMQNEETHEAAFATITAVYMDTQARKSFRIPTDVAERITTMRLHRDALLDGFAADSRAEQDRSATGIDSSIGFFLQLRKIEDTAKKQKNTARLLRACRLLRREWPCMTPANSVSFLQRGFEFGGVSSTPGRNYPKPQR